MPFPKQYQQWKMIIENYKVGTKLLRDKNYSSAKFFFKANLNLDPNDPIASFLFSYCAKQNNSSKLSHSIK